MPHNQLRMIFVDTEEVEKTNSKGSSQQNEEWSHNSSFSANLAHSEFHIFGSLIIELREPSFSDYDELKHGLREEHRNFSK